MPSQGRQSARKPTSIRADASASHARSRARPAGSAESALRDPRRSPFLLALLAIVTLATAAAPAGAQVPIPVRRQGADSVRLPRTRADSLAADSARAAAAGRDSIRAVPRDSVRRDTIGGAKRELIKWAPDDSVMAALLAREGYSITRYQGDTVRFDARTRVLDLVGVPAAVERDRQLLVGRRVVYDDSADVVVVRGDPARGDTVFLRDPDRDDVIVRGSITYDLIARRGVVTAFSTAVEQGQKWFVSGQRGAIVNDTGSVRGQTWYAHHGAITSCSETRPHYHFAVKELKVVAGNIMVARSAVLKIGEVPVMWLPFVFQDMRSGRRSGLITPQFGFGELVRNSPSYRRTLEQVGYYFALNDYTDARAWLDWRSGARSSDQDPGYLRYNGEFQYKWIDRFLSGRLATSYLSQNDGTRNTAVSWQHQQDFSQRSKLTANVNYTTSTTVQRRNEINPNAALGTIVSQVNFQQQLGRAAMSLGGSRRQYPGREQVDQDFPNFNISTQTLSLTPWLDWTPTLSLTNNQSFKIDQGGGANAFVFGLNELGDAFDSTRVQRGTRNTTLGFETPLRITLPFDYDFNWSNSFRLTETVNDFPESRVITDVRDTSVRSTRLFPRTFVTSIDWTTSFNLPRFFQGSWNLSPTVAVANVDPSFGFLVRTERSGGEYIRQSKRLQYGLSAAPTLYAFIPGFNVVDRLRHSITPSLSYSYSPEADVSDEFLATVGRTRVGYLGALAQNRVSLNVATNLEAKLRAPGDSAAPDQARKVRLLSMNFSSLTYDFARADSTGSGWTDQTFRYSARSDLLPGLDLSSTYNLYRGDVFSDTAVFKPYRTGFDVTFSLGPQSGLVTYVNRLLGRTPSSDAAQPQAGQGVAAGTINGRQDDDFFSRAARAQNVAGSDARNAQYEMPTGQGWSANFTYSSQRQRNDIIGAVAGDDPETRCASARPFGQLAFDQCVLEARTTPAGTPFSSTTLGSPIYVQQPTRSLQSNMSFNITQRWAAQWQTTYDLVRSEFASHQVSLQRELHDWRAIFAFTQSPNGNFSFNFFVALKAAPEIRLPFNSQTIRAQGAER